MAGIKTIGAVPPGNAPSLTTDGKQRGRILRATFDATGGLAMDSDYGLGVFLPDNAVIIRAWYEVATTFTSGTDACTISIGIPTDDAAGIVAALAISGVGDIWDATGTGMHECIQDGTAAAFSNKTTAQREITVTLGASEALTDGLFTLFCEYVVTL